MFNLLKETLDSLFNAAVVRAAQTLSRSVADAGRIRVSSDLALRRSLSRASVRFFSVASLAPSLSCDGSSLVIFEYSRVSAPRFLQPALAEESYFCQI
jgi:hypothetical protein